MAEAPKIIVGSEEWCGFPSLAIPAIKARVDSGAKTSSLHAFNIQPWEQDGQQWVRFEVHPLQNDRRTTVQCEAPVIDSRLIKSSSGLAEKRYVIRVPLALGEQEWPIELTLTNRDSMGYRMLLGREAMEGRILVDPAASFCQGNISPRQLIAHYGQPATQQDHLKIGLLATNPELYSNQRLLEAGAERGHDMHFLNITQCYMKLDAEQPEIHYRGGLILRDYDAVIPRIRPGVTFYGCALTRHFESLGVYALNSAEAISQARDKLYSLQILQRSGLNIPTTGFASSPDDTGDLIDMLGGAPLVVKLLEGTQGKGTVLAETAKGRKA